MKTNRKTDANQCSEYTNEAYWNNYWEEENRTDVSFYFDEIVDKYVDWTTVNSYLEIGGAPGSIMTYLHNMHGISVATIDFTDYRITEKFLNEHGVNDYEVVQEDFSKFRAESYGKKFDIVASWGFVEHFSKEQCNSFVDKHKKLVSERGYLIIELPNIRKTFWLMYYIFNRKLIKIHNLDIMDLGYLKNQILKGDEFDILYAGYYIAINEQNEYFVKHEKQKEFCKRVIVWVKKLKLHDSIKKWLFPYIILIARKR